MNRIRLGVIGCGGITSAHAAAYADVSSRMQVTAVSDVDAERAAAAAERFGAPFVCADYRELLPEVDAVLIALPHDLHYAAGMTCLAAGKHVLMEKPLANSEQECLDLLQAARSFGRVLMTAYPVRYHPLVRRLKALLDARAYGEVFQVSIFTEQHTEPPAGHWIRSAQRLGGGQLFSHGCHYIDLLLWLLGRPVRGTHMGTNLGTPWMEREGTSNVSLRFESGAIGMHFGTWGARATRLGYSIQAHCSEGLLELDYSRRRLYAHTKPAAPREGDPPAAASVELLEELPDGGKPTQYELRHFLDCIERGLAPETDAVGSLQGLRVIWRLYEAEAEGRAADLRGLGLGDDWHRVPLGHYGS